MKLNALDLNKIRVFCAVVEQQGYRGAAERLGLTRSALSQSISALEAQIGKALFYRSGTKLILTEEARRFYEEAMRYQNGLESALDRLHQRETRLQGVLRIGAYLEFAKSKLLPTIESFLVANPEAQIQFHFDSPSRLELLLERDRIDLSISIRSHQVRKIISQKLYEEELCLIGRRDLVSANPTAQELSQIPVIDYFPSHLLFKRWWAVHFKKAPAHVGTRVYAATAEMVLEMVQRRLGIGVVPIYLLQASSEKLHVIAPTPKRLIDHIWLNQKKISKNDRLREIFLAALERGLL